MLTDRVLEILSISGKAMPHLHIPLQSGSDKILRLMKRRYSSSDYLETIDKVKKYLPDACIGVDTIVGFPNELESEFLDTYHLLDSLDISYLHVFSYSERKKTAAEKISPKVSSDLIINRRNRLRLLSKNKYNSFILKNIKSKRNVLFESYEDGFLSGWTDNYIKVKVKGSSQLINTIHRVHILESINNCATGEFVE